MYYIDSDAPIIGSVIGIGHYWPLFLISVLVIFERCNRYCKIITIEEQEESEVKEKRRGEIEKGEGAESIIIEKILIFIERIRNLI